MNRNDVKLYRKIAVIVIDDNLTNTPQLTREPAGFDSDE